MGRARVQACNILNVRKLTHRTCERYTQSSLAIVIISMQWSLRKGKAVCITATKHYCHGRHVKKRQVVFLHAVMGSGIV